MLLVWKIIANSAWVVCWPGYLGRTQDHANKRREIRAGALSQWESRHRQNKFCDPTHYLASWWGWRGGLCSLARGEC